MAKSENQAVTRPNISLQKTYVTNSLPIWQLLNSFCRTIITAIASLLRYCLVGAQCGWRRAEGQKHPDGTELIKKK